MWVFGLISRSSRIRERLAAGLSERGREGRRDGLAVAIEKGGAGLAQRQAARNGKSLGRLGKRYQGVDAHEGS
jgi:hypothetical protein